MSQSFSQKSERMAQRLALMNDRYKNMERRRNLEREGYRNDIKSLRSRLKELEKQLYKVLVRPCSLIHVTVACVCVHARARVCVSGCVCVCVAAWMYLVLR